MLRNVAECCGVQHTAEFKAATAKANSELMNVARTVAMNAGYVPGGSKHAAAAAKRTHKGGDGKAAVAAVAAAAKQEEGSADAKKAEAKAKGKGEAPKEDAGSVAYGKVIDPDWEARKEMNQVWKGQRSFFKYDPAKADFYKYTPDAVRQKPGAVFAPEDRI